jgi:hypothetical protein
MLHSFLDGQSRTHYAHIMLQNSLKAEQSAKRTAILPLIHANQRPVCESFEISRLTHGAQFDCLVRASRIAAKGIPTRRLLYLSRRVDGTRFMKRRLCGADYVTEQMVWVHAASVHGIMHPVRAINCAAAHGADSNTSPAEIWQGHA